MMGLSPKGMLVDRPTTTVEIRTKILMTRRMIVTLMKIILVTKKKKIKPLCRNWEVSSSLDAGVAVNDEL